MDTETERNMELQKAVGEVVGRALDGGISAGVSDGAFSALMGSVAMSFAMAVEAFPEWGEQVLREGMVDAPNRVDVLRRLWVEKVPL